MLPAKKAAMKKWLCEVLWRAGGASAVRGLFNLRHPHALRILSGHRVIDAGGPLSDADRRDLARGCLSLAEFRGRIEYLRGAYAFASLNDCAARLREGRKPPAGALALTFDDGFRDVYDHALPYLIQRRIPFSVFLTTDWLGRPGMMTVEQVREMATKSGDLVSWGAHGVTHKPLTEMNTSDAEQEIVRSRERVEELVGSPVRLFCYPDGKYNAEIRRLLEVRGFLAACATGRRINHGAIDRYTLQRIPFESEPLARFAFRVAGWT
jgi:peptidoglycan/xylan/chitin deacetylase (PgdA/CDA1 family)